MMKFEDWYNQNWPRLTGLRFADGVREAWQAAQQAERDKARELVEAMQGLLDALPSATTHPAIKAARAAIASYHEENPGPG